MAGRNVKAERILAGVFGLFLSLGMLTKSLAVLVQALQRRAALPNHPSLQPELKEALLMFLLTLIIALALGWWGLSKFGRHKPNSAAAR